MWHPTWKANPRLLQITGITVDISRFTKAKQEASKPFSKVTCHNTISSGICTTFLAIIGWQLCVVNLDFLRLTHGSPLSTALEA